MDYRFQRLKIKTVEITRVKDHIAKLYHKDVEIYYGYICVISCNFGQNCGQKAISLIFYYS